MNAKARSLGATWMWRKRLAGGNVFAVDPARKGKVMEWLQEVGYLTLDPVWIKVVRVMSKEEHNRLWLVIPRVCRVSAYDLICRIVYGPVGESVVSARVSPLGEESKLVVV